MIRGKKRATHFDGRWATVFPSRQKRDRAFFFGAEIMLKTIKKLGAQRGVTHRFSACVGVALNKGLVFAASTGRIGSTQFGFVGRTVALPWPVQAHIWLPADWRN